jgi:PAS domain S-box-containing protein
MSPRPLLTDRENDTGKTKAQLSSELAAACKKLSQLTEALADRERIEKKLRGDEEKFRLVADFTNDWELWISPNGSINYISPSCERITGYRTEELLDDPDIILKMIFPDDLALYKDHLKAHLVEPAGPGTVTYRILTKTGETRWIDHVCQPVYGSNGEWLGSRASNRDITERKRAEEAMQVARAQAELYVDLMGHDINNMNMIALGSLEIALMELEQAGKIDRSCIPLLKKSIESLNSSSQLIRNVQKLQRASTEGISLNAINATALLESVIDEFRHFPGKELTIDFSSTGDCTVRVNELLKDVYINLIDNAIKHSCPDRPLVINISMDSVTEYGKKYCRFTIDDNGPGIPDDVKRKLFTRFTRGKTKATGSGLGLYLVKTLIEHYGGRIQVEDRVPGDHTKGVKFMVLLPAVESIINS